MMSDSGGSAHAHRLSQWSDGRAARRGASAYRRKSGETLDTKSKVEDSTMAAARLREHYQKSVVPALTKEFGYKNVMAVPKIERSRSTSVWAKPRRTPS